MDANIDALQTACDSTWSSAASALMDEDIHEARMRLEAAIATNAVGKQ